MGWTWILQRYYLTQCWGTQVHVWLLSAEWGKQVRGRAELLGTRRKRLTIPAVVCLFGFSTTDWAARNISRDYLTGCKMISCLACPCISMGPCFLIWTEGHMWTDLSSRSDSAYWRKFQGFVPSSSQAWEVGSKELKIEIKSHFRYLPAMLYLFFFVIYVFLGDLSKKWRFLDSQVSTWRLPLFFPVQGVAIISHLPNSDF